MTAFNREFAGQPLLTPDETNLAINIASNAPPCIFAALGLPPPDELARYASTAGKMNPGQPDLIRAALLHMPESAELIAATDADPHGRKLAEQLQQIAAEAGRGFRAHMPATEGADWNDHLRPLPQPLATPEP